MSIDRKTAEDMVWLLSCTVNRITPEPERARQIDLDGLFEFAQRHSLTAAVAAGLEAAGITDQRFTMAKAMAMRKAVLFEAEKKKVCAMLDEKGIRYMLLKGSLIKYLYPVFWMREMADIDILCDSSRMADVREGMEALGYACTSFDVSNHDCYAKPPVGFEMHRRLFSQNEGEGLHDYYYAVFDRLLKDDDNAMGYHFSVEDMYVYLIAHEYKHYCHAGTGLRSPLDTYLYLGRYSEELDRATVDSALAATHLTDFEKMNREMAADLFGKGKLPDQYDIQTNYMLAAGVYGTSEFRSYNHLTRELKGKDTFGAKLRHLFGLAFLRGEKLKTAYPFFYRHKILLPALDIFRIFRAIFIRPKKTLSITKGIMDYHKTIDVDHVDENSSE